MAVSGSSAGLQQQRGSAASYIHLPINKCKYIYSMSIEQIGCNTVF